MADDDVVEGTDTSDELIEQLAQLASDKELTLGCAESLTAGTLAARLGAAKGSSDWFRGGIVAYSREVKYGLLEVAEGPVVCESAARTMAESTSRLLGAGIVVAVSGAGGPDPQDGRPPGTVCFATTGPDGTRSEEQRFDGDPEKVLAKTVRHALSLLVERASA
ncbi:CinA family protein [Rhodococcus rhodochrous]|uniref:CinA family protein n=1 Tax=Rhodococcus rhodochrous TaxID=1829 RepID=UPI001E4B4127|nr:CinA family protein [Rhodococcus rhodochrous]MCD2098355.1 CinA family protein [Rhodococcus rhodochrous]MCD2122376.1 CinA family protein [Rhodococcus rhodochrous]MCQ4134090.1 CinA family protein [Rhodococcus rhodochrous]MDJ0019345.1 CinA family protein [Rhodococcus rhodochrous]